MRPLKIEKVGNRIHLDPGRQVVNGDGIGARWSKARRVWTLPLTMRTCKMLRDTFGDVLEIGPDLWAWADEQNRLQQAAEGVHKMDVGKAVHLENVEQLAPTMYAAMLNRGYQTLVAQFGATVGSHFNGSEPGAGKTIETFGALLERGLIGGWWLVAAPRKALHATWVKEAEKWLSDMTVNATVVDSEVGSVAKRRELLAELMSNGPTHDINMVLVNPEMIRMKAVCSIEGCKGTDGFCPESQKHRKEPNVPELFQVRWDAIVFDETHKYMMRANPRSKSVSQQGLGMQSLRLSPEGIKVGLSGTPFKGKPRRFWPVLHWLDPKRYTGQWDWQKHYFETERNQWSQTGIQITDRMREDRKAEFYSELDRIMIRHTKAELRALNPEWAPPAKRYAEVWVPMDRKQAKQYADLEETFSVELDGRVLTADGVLAIMTREKQLAIACGSIDDNNKFHPTLPSAKWDWIVEYLDSKGILDEPHGSDKVIIASQFVEVLKLYSDQLSGLNVAHYVVTGQTKDMGRIQDDWQGNPDGRRVLLLGTTAGGVSLTLDAADTVIVNDETFVPDDQTQVEDRAHRTSRTDHQVDVVYLRTEGTIEREIAGDNEWKDDTQRRVLDARRGIEITKSKFNIAAVKG